MLDSLVWDDDIAEAALAAGVPAQRVRSRLKDPDFAEELNRRLEARLDDPHECVVDGRDLEDHGLDDHEDDAGECAAGESSPVTRGGGTSAKQVAANRRNAARSTGPRTQEGKAKSSRNSTRHGVYASELYPIRSGPLAENQQAFHERAELLIGGFDPQDALEAELAKRGVKALMAMARLDRFEAILVTREGVPDAMTETLLGSLWDAESDIFAATQLVAMVELDAQHKLPVDAGLQVGDFEYSPTDWALIAPLVRTTCSDLLINVPDLWDDDHTPETPEAWAEAVRSIWRHFWPDQDDRLAWARGVLLAVTTVSERTRQKTEALLASRIINVAMQPLERPRTHAWKEFNQAMSQLQALRRLRNPEA